MPRSSFEKREILKRKRYMRQAFDHWRSYERNGSKRKRVWTDKEGYTKLRDKINEQFENLGYTISRQSVVDHFYIGLTDERRAIRSAPYFLLEWYAHEFGVTIDELLTGKRNSKIMYAQDHEELLRFYDDEMQLLRADLGERLKEFERNKLRQNEDLRDKYGDELDVLAFHYLDEESMALIEQKAFEQKDGEQDGKEKD